ncbi:unnamed protein product, partial [Durusdinium trenchii]
LAVRNLSSFLAGRCNQMELSPVWHRLRVRRKSVTAYTLATVVVISLLAGLLHSCAASPPTKRVDSDLEANLSPAARCALHCAANVIGTADSAANRTVDVTRSMWSRLVHASSAAKVSSAASMAELAQEASRASTWVAASPLAQSGAQQAKAIRRQLGRACVQVVDSAQEWPKSLLSLQKRPLRCHSKGLIVRRSEASSCTI